MSKKIKVGDRVLLRNCNAVGVVQFVGKDYSLVDFGLGNSTVSTKDLLPAEYAFIAELKVLLNNYDAEIWIENGCGLQCSLNCGRHRFTISGSGIGYNEEIETKDYREA